MAINGIQPTVQFTFGGGNTAAELNALNKQSSQGLRNLINTGLGAYQAYKYWNDKNDKKDAADEKEENNNQIADYEAQKAKYEAELNDEPKEELVVANPVELEEPPEEEPTYYYLTGVGGSYQPLTPGQKKNFIYIKNEDGKYELVGNAKDGIVHLNGEK